MGAAGLLGAAGITGGAGIISTIASNKANKDIQQLSNQFNERMLDKQIAYNKEMYQTQLSDSLKYSDPSFIRQRLQDAGFNPNVMAGSGLGSVGSVTSPSAQGINPPTSAQRTADFSGIGEAIGDAVDLYTRAKQSESVVDYNSAAAQNLRIEGKYKASQMLAEIGKIRAETKSTEVRSAIDKMLASFDADLKGSQTELNRENAGVSRLTQRIQILDAAMKSKQLEFLPQQLKLSLANGAANVALMKSQKNLTDAEVRHEVRKMINTVLEGQAKNLQNQFDKQTFDSRKRTIEAELIKICNNMGPDLMFGLGNAGYILQRKLDDLFK